MEETMAEPEALHFNLTITNPNSTDDELDRLTRQLLMELKDLDVESVSMASGNEAPVGAKGLDSVTAGTIALTVMPTVLPAILEFLQAWSFQGRGRMIKFKGRLADQQIEFEGSFDEMNKPVALLEQKQKKLKKK